MIERRQRSQNSGAEQGSTPEQRTTALWEQDVDTLKDKFVEGDGMVIALPGTDKKVRMVTVDGFRRVGNYYKAIVTENKRPGELWNPGKRQISQSLIITEQVYPDAGACLRLVEVEYWDSSRNEFVENCTRDGEEFKQSREGDIAKYFGFEKNETSKLKYLDDSETLYIVRQGAQQSTQEVSRERTIRDMFVDVFGEAKKA